MPRVKIVGAGSIGNHLAHASRQLGWEVVVCDVDAPALVRMQREIFPSRYGAWDPAIQLCMSHEAPRGGFDLICIGTPPDTHLPLAVEALGERPRALLVEKPLCPPSLALAEEFFRAAGESSTAVFVGYDHVVGRAAREAAALVHGGAIGDIHTLDVEFREHWGGIFAAHPWLRGPEDSYLGFWERGGGASGEHSHAINLWQHFAHVAGAGRIIEVDARIHYETSGKARYDSLCLLHLKTERGLLGRVVQDVVTMPPRKRAWIQGSRGAVEWVNGYSSDGDAVIIRRPQRPDEVSIIPKTRPDDFIEELRHVWSAVSEGARTSDIRLERGLETIVVVAAAHRSEAQQCRMEIDDRHGYTVESIRRARAREMALV